LIKRFLQGCAPLALIATLCVPIPASAQTSTDRAVELFTCKDVMREPNTSREVAIAFLHGFLLGKSGGSRFNVEALEKQTSAFIEQCLDDPKGNAVDVMARIKK
jgi:hypothetical protein